MSSISTSEAPRILSAERYYGSDGLASKEGLKQHRSIQGDLMRRIGQVFPGYEGRDVIPEEFGKIHVAERNGQTHIGDGTILTARVDDYVLDGSALAEFKPAETRVEASFYWIQVALEVVVFPVKFAFLLFYKTGKLFLFRPPHSDEYESFLKTVAIQASQIRDRQEEIDLIDRTYSGQYYAGDQQRAIFLKRGEVADAYEYSDHLSEENIRQRRVMEYFMAESLKVISQNTEEIE